MLDLTYLTWRNTNTTQYTQGVLYKVHDNEKYYKLSSIVAGKILGHEAINEVIASRYLDILGIEHTTYEVALSKVVIDSKQYMTPVCFCNDFKRPGEEAYALADIFPVEGGLEAYDWVHKSGLGYDIDILILVDFLINNLDRHGANIELIKSPNNNLRLAPIFDNGASFIYSVRNRESLAATFDVTADYSAGNHIGSDSLFDNLNLIRNPILVNPLNNQKQKIFYGLSRYISQVHIDKIWELITWRYNYAKDKKVLVEKGRGAKNTGLFDI